MADEADTEPTVTLTADAGPFEAALDRAGEAVGGWAGRVSSKFETLSAAISAKTAGITSLIGSITTQAADTGDIAGTVGSVLGGALGTAVGGPVGTMIGAQLGESIAKGLEGVIDFAGIFDTIGEGQDLFAQQKADATESWGAIKDTVRGTWDEIKGLVRGLDLAGLLAGSVEDVEARFNQLGADIGAKVEGATGQVAARVSDLIDRTVERVKAPLGAVLDFVQQLATRFGLVEESTDKWGDSVRNLQDVGMTVFKAIATALGYVNDALAKVGGAVYLVLVKPLVEGAQTIAKTLRAVAELGRQLPGGEEFFGRIVKGLDVTDKKLAELNKRATDWSAKAFQREIGETGEEWAKRIEAMIEKGRWENWAADLLKKMKAEDVGPEAVDDPAAGVLARAGERPSRVQANIAGSSEAVRAIIADAGRGAPVQNDPQKQAADAAKDNVKVNKDQLKVMNQLRDRLDQPLNLNLGVG